MLTHPLFTFAQDNPWLTMGLSLPLASVLVSISYLTASNIESAMNLVLRLANLLTIWLRGYPPVNTPQVPASVEPTNE